MNRDSVCLLISETYETDELNQKKPVETARQVFCRVDSVTRAEFYNAGQAGLNPSAKLIVFFGDYEGEKIVDLGGKRYGVYRTYTPDEETVELYLERKVGI